MTARSFSVVFLSVLAVWTSCKFPNEGGDDPSSPIELRDVVVWENQQLRVLTDSAYCSYPRFCRDDSMIVYILHRRGLQGSLNSRLVVSSLDGSRRMEIMAGLSPFGEVSVSPDSRQALVSARGDFSEEVFLVDLVTGGFSAATSTSWRELDPSYAPGGQSFVCIEDLYSSEEARWINRLAVYQLPGLNSTPAERFSDETRLRNPLLLPGGGIAYVKTEQLYGLMVRPPAGGRITVVEPSLAVTRMVSGTASDLIAYGTIGGSGMKLATIVDSTVTITEPHPQAVTPLQFLSGDSEILVVTSENKLATVPANGGGLLLFNLPATLHPETATVAANGSTIAGLRVASVR